MQQYTLNITNRESTGRGVARRLRASGKIPASLYGQGNARSITVAAVDFRDLNREIGGGAALVELTDEKGDTALCLVQDVQYHACLLYTSPSPRDRQKSRMPSSA